MPRISYIEKVSVEEHLENYELLLRQYKGLLVKNAVLQGLNDELVDKLTYHRLKHVIM